MTRHLHRFPDDDEIANAFDVESIEPSEEHIQQLRDQIALHTTPMISPASATSTGGKCALPRSDVTGGCGGSDR